MQDTCRFVCRTGPVNQRFLDYVKQVSFKLPVDDADECTVVGEFLVRDFQAICIGKRFSVCRSCGKGTQWLKPAFSVRTSGCFCLAGDAGVVSDCLELTVLQPWAVGCALVDQVEDRARFTVCQIIDTFNIFWAGGAGDSGVERIGFQYALARSNVLDGEVDDTVFGFESVRVVFAEAAYFVGLDELFADGELPFEHG